MVRLTTNINRTLEVVYFERNILVQHDGTPRSTLLCGTNMDPTLNPKQYDAPRRAPPNIEFPDMATALLYHDALINIDAEGVAVNSSSGMKDASRHRATYDQLRRMVDVL